LLLLRFFSFKQFFIGLLLLQLISLLFAQFILISTNVLTIYSIRLLIGCIFI